MNVAEVLEQKERLWPAEPQVAGIDFNDDSHRFILGELFPRYIGGYDYPENGSEDSGLTTFYTRNSQFGWLDSRALFVLLRAWAPKRIIEVGSGYSSLLMADINRRFAAGSMSITCVEPYPRDFLRKGVPGISSLVTQKVQDTSTALYSQLQAGDVLFIDSSHVAKTGSDVNFLYFEVLPRLAQGVRVHIHDIFLPDEYLQDWVVSERRSWNEQYVLRAMLMHSRRYKVIFGCNYAFRRYPELVRSALALPTRAGFGGGSFWIEVGGGPSVE